MGAGYKKTRTKAGFFTILYLYLQNRVYRFCIYFLRAYPYLAVDDLSIFKDQDGGDVADSEFGSELLVGIHIYFSYNGFPVVL